MIWNVVSLGAGLTIAAIGIKASMQQIPVFSQGTVASGKASLPQVESIIGHEVDGAYNHILNRA